MYKNVVIFPALRYQRHLSCLYYWGKRYILRTAYVIVKNRVITRKTGLVAGTFMLYKSTSPLSCFPSTLNKNTGCFLHVNLKVEKMMAQCLCGLTAHLMLSPCLVSGCLSVSPGFPQRPQDWHPTDKTLHLH